jgi:NAD(P)-dependent dehydrogenase (short-subunit alcohol dehydrogenase family)
MMATTTLASDDPRTASVKTEENRPLAGKVMVVTGGSRGIGRMIATGLLQAGATVYISSRKPDKLDATAADLSRLGEVRAFSADLATPEGVHALAGHEAVVHALFNNAGANWGAPLQQFPTAAWDRVMNLNVKGLFGLTQALLPLLRAASQPDDPARIVNIGSIDGLLAPAPGFDNFSYSASKAAVHLLTQQLATTLAPEVLVNAIAPGLFESRMTATLLAAGEVAIAEQIPLRRIGRPRDIADLAVFLTGAGSTYITGAIIPVDGGVVAGRK